MTISDFLHVDGYPIPIYIGANEITPLWAKVGFTPWVRVTGLATEG